MPFKGDRVSTPLGEGTVAFVRLGPPVYTKVQSISVVLDCRKGEMDYQGTIFAPNQVVVV